MFSFKIIFKAVRFAALKLCHPLKKRNGIVKCQINQIASLIKVSILEATHRESACSVEGAAHAGIAAAEDEAARTSTANRTAPIVAVGTTNTDESTIGEVAVARPGQF